MSNVHLRDKALSLKAKGLLSLILSLPDGWEYSIKGLAAISKEGRDGINSGLQELEAAGYLVRKPLRGAHGHFGQVEYVIYETPQPPNTDIPDTANPDTEKPDTVTAKTKVRNDQEVGTILSAEQKKRLVKQKLREQKAQKVPHTSQQTIAYQEMFQDGICRVDDRHYTKSILFGDINYQLAQKEDQTEAFELWCDWYNYFDSSISVQITCMSQYANAAEMEKRIQIPFCAPGFEPIATELDGILKKQMAKGNNGLQRVKYVTFGVEASDD